MNDIKIKFNIPFKGSLDNAVPLDISKRIPTTVTGESVTIPNTELGYINSVELQGNTIGGGGTPETPIEIKSVESPLTIYSTPQTLHTKNIEQGGFVGADGTPTAQSNRVKTVGTITLDAGTYKLYFTGADQWVMYVWDLDDEYLAGEGLYANWNDKLSQITLTEARKVKFAFRRQDNSNFLPSEMGNIQLFNALNAEFSIPIKDTAGNDLTLRRVGTVYDSVYKDTDGKWYINKKVNAITFNGTEGWAGVMAGTYASYSMSLSPAASDPALIPDILSSHFIKNSYDNLTQGLVSYGVGVGHSLISPTIVIRHKDIATLADFITWLASNPVNVVYKLATPQIIELHADTATALEAIKTYEGTTNIFGTNTVNPILNVNANIIGSAMAINSKPLRHELGKTISITETLPTQKLTFASFTNIKLELGEPMEFTVCGKNLLDKENNLFQGSFSFADGGNDSIITDNSRVSTKKIAVPANKTLAISGTINFEFIGFYTKDGVFIDNSPHSPIRTPINASYARLRFYSGSSSTPLPLSTMQELDLQLEYGTVSTYEAYNGTNYSIPIVDNLGNQIQMSQVDKIALDYASGKYRIAEKDLSTATQTALHGILCKDGTTTVSSANDIIFETPYRFDDTQLGMYIWNLKSSATATTLGDYVGNATLTLYFDSIEPFDNATVYFDDAVGMWATRAYCDGIVEDIIYNDDFRWDIKFDDAATSHRVTFTHWSVGDSEFRVNSVFPINGVFEIGHRYIDEVTSFSQSCADNSKPTYGVLANTGLTQLRANEILDDLIMDSIIPDSGFDIEVYANGKQVQTHTAGESDYDALSKTLSLNLTNKIDSVFNKNYYSYPLKSPAKDALSLLEDIMGTVGFTHQDVIDMVMGLSGNSSLFDKLANFLYITSPYINLCTVSQAINKVCELAQMQFIQRDNGKYRFINARPIYWQQDIQDIIKIPKKNQYVQFKTESAIPKNIIKTVNAKVNKLNQGFGRISEEVKIVYYEQDTYVGDTKNNSAYQVSPISFDILGRGSVTSHIRIPINKKFLYNTDYIGDDGYNNRAIQIYGRFSFELEDLEANDGTYFYRGEATEFVDSSEAFWMIGQATNIKVTRDLITFDYIDRIYTPGLYRTINKTFYVETISNWGTGFYLQPETVDYSKSGNVSNGTAISLPPNELINDIDGFQEVIADNILKDYATGILTAKTTINCDNYYKLNGDIAKDWEQGQVIEVGDIVRIDNDNIGTSASNYKDGTPRYWRVTGRKFRKSGVPRIDLELMEVKLTDESPL